MARYEGSVTINAPVEKVFGYIMDPASHAEWMPSLMEVKDVNMTEQRVGSHWRWAWKMVGLRFEGETTITEYIPNERLVWQSTGAILSTWVYTFEPEDGGTKVNVVVEYTVPIPVLGKVAEAFVLSQVEREADFGVANLKARMEG
ncbi:MAG: SRPBCC family protein [Anaerolineae bacterium]